MRRFRFSVAGLMAVILLLAVRRWLHFATRPSSGPSVDLHRTP